MNLTAILQAILVDPDDDLPRLAYADWCEENGQAERAKFIRSGLAGQTHQCLSWSASSRPAGNRHPRDVWPASWWSAQDGLPQGPEYVWRRGFIDAVICRESEWLEHGPAIVRIHPIQRVEFSNKDPLLPEDACAWMTTVSKSGNSGRDHLDERLFAHLCRGRETEYGRSFFQLLLVRFYDSDEEARADLSSACLRWARAVIAP